MRMDHLRLTLVVFATHLTSSLIGCGGPTKLYSGSITVGDEILAVKVTA